MDDFHFAFPVESHKLTVAKFGGSSLSTEEQFQKVRNIVTSDPARRIVVVSAIGRKEAKDDKVTDLLYLIAAHKQHGVSYQDLWQNFTARFYAVQEMLGLKFDLQYALFDLKQKLDRHLLSEDDLVSRGENLTAHLMAEYLGFEFLDAGEVIYFNNSGQIDLEQTKTKLRERLDLNKNYVIPGFYGVYPNGKIHLMSRGGSDISGAILANCLSADKYENWTDVSGVLVADPRVIKNPASIHELTYDELSELASLGASVLHPATIHPIRELKIPLQIKNTNAPENPGTSIILQHRETQPTIAGITGKKNFVAILIESEKVSSDRTFLSKTLDIFKHFHIKVEQLPSTANNVSLIVEAGEVEIVLPELLEQLQTSLEADHVTAKENLSLVTVVGEGLVRNAELVAQIFQALATADIPIDMITQSPRDINIIIGIASSHLEKAIEAIYQRIIENNKLTFVNNQD